MLRRSFSWVTLGLFVFACNADTFTNTDGAAPDASGDAPVVSGGDGGGSEGGSVDGSSSDAGPSVDGSVDGPTCLGPSFCSSTSGATLCADFDEQAGAAVGWSGGATTQGGYTLGTTQSHFKSCPSALMVTVPQGDGGAHPASALLTDTPSLNGSDGGLAYTQWVLDFDLWTPNPSVSQTFLLGHLQTIPGEIGLAHTASGWAFDVGGGWFDPVSIPTNQWTHVTIYVKFTPYNQYASTITIDSQTPVSRTMYDPTASPPTLSAVVGVSTDTNATPGSFFYDNVVLTLLP